MWVSCIYLTSCLKSNIIRFTTTLLNGQYMTKTASEYLLDTSKEYSIYVNEHRAIPKVSDGLKDGQRKALFLMSKRNEKIKTVSLSGLMIASNLYLHGDTSASDTISLLAAPFTNNIPLLEGEGTFGTRVAPVEGISAPRYTYVKKGKAAIKLMFQDLDIIPMKENYDGSTMEPETFLPIIPTILLNGISGIAVGWSTEILPRNIKAIIKATISAIDGKKVQRMVPSYDYLGVKVSHLEDNTWEFTGSATVIDVSTVHITELPPDITLDKFITRLISLEEDGKIRDFEDNSTDHINIKVKFKRGIVKKWSDAKAIRFFKLKSKKTERIVVINWDGKSIRQYESAETLVEDFVAWRFKLYVARYQKFLDDTIYDLLYWLAVKACFDNNLPSRLVKMKDKKSVEAAIKKLTTGLDNSQLDKIASLPTYRWTKEALVQCKEKIKELKVNKKEYTRLLKKPTEIREIYKREVIALSKERFV